MTSERDSLAHLIAQLPQRLREPLIRALEEPGLFEPKPDDAIEHIERILQLAKSVLTLQPTPLGFLELAGEIIVYVGDLVSGHGDLDGLRGQLAGLAAYEASKTAGQTAKCGKCHGVWNPKTHDHLVGSVAGSCVTIPKKWVE